MSDPRQENTDASSKLLLEEYFLAEDARFLDCFRELQSSKYLASFVDKWIAKNSSWSREQLIIYLFGDLNLPGHEPVVRRIFKHFAEVKDHEMMGVLMVTFDRSVRRSIVWSRHYNKKKKQFIVNEWLYAKPNQTHHDEVERYHEYVWHGRKTRYPLPPRFNKPDNKLFSNRTRNYFRRAAWRYFRFLSYREPEVYVEMICRALARYEDQDFEAGENIIDNWGLMHACYFHHDAIEFSAAHTNVVEGKSLAELKAMPYQPALWKELFAVKQLIELLVTANSRLIRIWAMELLRELHPETLENLELEYVLRMLNSDDSMLRDFAVEVFKGHPSLDHLSVEQWLEIVERANVLSLDVICTAMRSHIKESELNRQQLIDLTCAKSGPISLMGIEWLKTSHQQNKMKPAELCLLAGSQCLATTKQVFEFALKEIDESGEYLVEHVIDFFDTAQPIGRLAATEWLRTNTGPAFQDPKLWARLSESPYDDVQNQLVEILGKRARFPELEPGGMVPVWVSVLLNIHRGGRGKPKAIKQVANQILANPEDADSLIPVLALAVRSIRGPEMRHGLAALARLAESSNDLKDLIRQQFPELEFLTTSEVMP